MPGREWKAWLCGMMDLSPCPNQAVVVMEEADYTMRMLLTTMLLPILPLE